MARASSPCAIVRHGQDAHATAGAALSPRQLSAIDLLFAGASFMDVCRQLRVDRKTLYRWRQSAGFAAEVRRRYRQHLVARKPPSREGAIIPPARAIQGVVVPKGAAVEDPYEAFRAGGPMPPPREDEPFWVKEIRRTRAARAALEARRKS